MTRPENQFSRLVNKIATPAGEPVWGSPEWHEEMRASARRAMTTKIITIEELCGLPPNGEIGDSGGHRHGEGHGLLDLDKMEAAATGELIETEDAGSSR